MSENDELLAKIGQLAGHINRHKGQQNLRPENTRYQPYNKHDRPSTYQTLHTTPYWKNTTQPAYSLAAAPYRGRGRGRGGMRGTMISHRHRSLVLNNSTPVATQLPEGQSIEVTSDTTSADSTRSPTPAASIEPTTGGWIAKRDRHMQLINPAVYDQQALARTKAMEKTRLDKLKRREEKEKMKLKSFLQRSEVTRVASGQPRAAVPQHGIILGGTRFHLAGGGSKLVKASGKCVRGKSCPYTHDPNRVAICPKFLHGTCPDGDSCDLSHDSTPNRVPSCLHFSRGNCSNSICKYAHVKVNPSAPICKPFAREGYCEKGAECTERHIYECPEFDETGVCNDKTCKLPHIDHAGRRRGREAAIADKKDASSKQDENSSDISSDEDDEDEPFDSDDVGSDNFSDDEVIIGANNDHELSQQQDFVGFQET